MRIILLTLLLSIPSISNAADIWVTDLIDDFSVTNGTCTLREAINSLDLIGGLDACVVLGTLGSNDTIYFSKSGTIELIAGLPIILKHIKFIGPGAELLTIDANGFDRVFHVYSEITGLNVEFHGMTIRGGVTHNNGGGIYFEVRGGSLLVSDCKIMDNEAMNGGGLYVRGPNGDWPSATVLRTAFDNNSAEISGGGIQAYQTDAPSGTFARILVMSTTLSNNSAEFGGGIDSWNVSLQVFDTTVSGNNAIRKGGGIHFATDSNPPFIDIRNSTITDNDAQLAPGDGGGVYIANASNQYFSNNIIAGNRDLDGGPNLHPDLRLAPGIDVGGSYNFVGSNEGAFGPVFAAGNPNANNNYVGTNLAPLDANLAALVDGGGPTMVHGINPFVHPHLVDQGSCPSIPYDQRGFESLVNPGSRISDSMPSNAEDGCDIGAYEYATIPQKPEMGFIALLDGPYDNIIMNTNLNMAGQIPLSHPFSDAPWNLFAFETISAPSLDMVDWILLDFVEGIPGDPSFNVVHSEAMVMNDNGQIFHVDERRSNTLLPGYYYLRLRHRNHLAIMTAGLIKYDWGSPIGYDFRIQALYSNGGQAARIRDGLQMMWAGDGDLDGQVSAFDFLNIWLPANGGVANYSIADFNLDGDVTAFDFLNAWLPSNGQAAQTGFTGQVSGVRNMSSR